MSDMTDQKRKSSCIQNTVDFIKSTTFTVYKVTFVPTRTLQLPTNDVGGKKYEYKVE